MTLNTFLNDFAPNDPNNDCFLPFDSRILTIHSVLAVVYLSTQMTKVFIKGVEVYSF
ncbi:hypothetical protein [Runella aurantiaca]|uniref:hypothetical protein n=1 Tax=Runella aurantiaca TaxID=2282308 RepID=UPI001314F539|nr:hypothetical protein [Runella aurantiaca]